MNLEEIGNRVSAARAETLARGETFYPGASRVHLAAFPPKERWDDWTYTDSRRVGRREIERVITVEAAQDLLEPLEGGLGPRVLAGEVLRPVPPAPDELAVVTAGPDQVTGDREQDRRLGTGAWRQPVVGVGGGVGQPRVEDDHFRAARLGVGDPLGVRVEVVAGFQMRADQQDDVGVRVVGAGPVDAHPEVVARPGAGGAHVGVRVVPVNAPAGQDPLGEAVFPRPPDMVHDLVPAVLRDRRPDPGGDVLQRLVPADLRPAALAAPAGPLERVQDPVRVGDLVERGGPLGAVTPAGAGMLGVALELADGQGVAVDVSKQAAG